MRSPRRGRRARRLGPREAFVIKRAETLDDVLAREVLPPHLEAAMRLAGGAG